MEKYIIEILLGSILFFQLIISIIVIRMMYVIFNEIVTTNTKKINWLREISNNIILMDTDPDEI